jgi:hypothetical protein
MAQVLLLQGIALAKMTAEQWGDPYTYVPRLIASAAAIAGVFVSAVSAINQANSVQLYAEGTGYHTGGGAIVGEKVVNGQTQPELVKAGGKAFIVDQPTYFKDFPIGAQVIPFDKMTNEQADMSETNELLKQIAAKQQVNINFGRTTNSQLIKGLTRTTILNKRFRA